MSTYLQRAEWAIDYVSNTVRIKTGNRFEGINRLPSEKKSTNKKVDESRAFARSTFKAQGLKASEEVSLRAQLAEYCRSGNCTEQSAVAFEYLSSRGEKKMAWIGFPDHNHMLTVLGLRSRPPDEEIFKIGDGPPASWGPCAVVCDPWYHEWFVADADWDRKIIHILRQTSVRRIAKGMMCKVECRGYV